MTAVLWGSIYLGYGFIRRAASVTSKAFNFRMVLLTDRCVMYLPQAVAVRDKSEHDQFWRSGNTAVIGHLPGWKWYPDSDAVFRATFGENWPQRSRSYWRDNEGLSEGKHALSRDYHPACYLHIHCWSFAKVFNLNFKMRFSTNSIVLHLPKVRKPNPWSLATFQGVACYLICVSRLRDLMLSRINITDKIDERDDFDTEAQPLSNRLAQGFAILMIAVVLYRRSVRWRSPWWPIIGVAIFLVGLWL